MERRHVSSNMGKQSQINGMCAGLIIACITQWQTIFSKTANILRILLLAFPPSIKSIHLREMEVILAIVHNSLRRGM
jgi:hypothetical protein